MPINTLQNPKKLSDFDILEFGHSIQITGMILSGQGQHFLVRFPDEPKGNLWDDPIWVLEFDTESWEKFLYQSDVLEVELQGVPKAIVRKSQRQIDQNVAWAVYARDEYKCRYCGNRRPLTVDHVVTWESGGPSVIENLISSCRPCNRLRGMRTYVEWLGSADYKRISQGNVAGSVDARNHELLTQLPHLETLRVEKQRSR